VWCLPYYFYLLYVYSAPFSLSTSSSLSLRAILKLYLIQLPFKRLYIGILNLNINIYYTFNVLSPISELFTYNILIHSDFDLLRSERARTPSKQVQNQNPQLSKRSRELRVLILPSLFVTLFPCYA